MLSCRDVARLLSESMDRELSLKQRMGLRFHLMMCKLCSRYERYLSFIRKSVRRYNVESGYEVPGDPALPDAARKKIEETLKQKISDDPGL